MEKARGVRILLNLNNCAILLEGEGVAKILDAALARSGLTVVDRVIRFFPDGTPNIYYGLSESHVSGGGYLKGRHLAFEIVVCHESRDNTDKACALADALIQVLSPVSHERQELQWEAR